MAAGQHISWAYILSLGRLHFRHCKYVPLSIVVQHCCRLTFDEILIFKNTEVCGVSHCGGDEDIILYN